MEQKNLFSQILDFVLNLLNNQVKPATVSLTGPTVDIETPKFTAPPTDWADPKSHITAHFTVDDALTLHSWNRLATQADGADFDKLLILFNKMEEIRSLLNCPINVHCGFRSQTYNQEQGIKPTADVHSLNMAVDFDCNPNLSIDQVKDILRPKLDELNIRMEFGTTTWVHIDLHSVGPSGREFRV